MARSARFLVPFFFLALLLGPTITLGRTVPQSPGFARDPFTDIAKTNPYYEAIEYFRTNNVLKGYPDGTFKPSRRITRAEFVKLITHPLFLQAERVNDCVKEHFADGITKIFFSDVQRSDWFAEEVCLAHTTNIIRGYPDDTFRPLRPISFVESAKIVSTVLRLQVRQDSAGDDKWYTAYVQELGGLKAIPTSVRALDQTMTRGEVTEMIYRLKMQKRDRASQTWQELLR